MAAAIASRPGGAGRDAVPATVGRGPSVLRVRITPSAISPVSSSIFGKSAER